MALQRRHVDEYGVTHTAAYVRIVNILLQCGDAIVMQVRAYHNEVARSKGDVDSMKTPFLVFEVSAAGTDFTTYFADTVLDDENKNITKQGYAFLKTQVLPIDLTSSTTDV